MVALATNGIALPAWCDGVLEKLAATLAPLALVSIPLSFLTLPIWHAVLVHVI